MTARTFQDTLTPMRSTNEHKEPSESVLDRELRLLSEIERTPGTNQRTLSRRIGAAVGMTNLLLRALGHKGYVRVARAGWRSWIYSLTPAGFSRKAQLTVAYIGRVLERHQEIREALYRELEPLGLDANSRVAIYGTGQFAELVGLALREMGIERWEVVGATRDGTSVLGRLVLDVADIDGTAYDRVVVTPLTDPSQAVSRLREAGVPEEKLVVLFGTASSTSVGA